MLKHSINDVRKMREKILELMMAEGSLAVKLPTIWTDEKQRWEESEKRREEKRRRKKITKEKASEGRRSRCAKR